MGEADWWLIAVRFTLYLSMGGLFGLAAFALYGLKAGERATALPLRLWLVAGAASALLLSLVSVVLLASEMAGVPAWPVDRDALGALLAGTAIGLAWKARVAALVITGLAGWLGADRAGWLWAATLASGAALATLAWAGHAAVGEGAVRWVHLVGDILHLLAAGAWVGALLALFLMVARPLARVDSAHLALSHRALHEFGPLGTIVVGTITLTGLVNGWLLVGPGNVATLVATPYGGLLLAKLVLFMAMLGLASLNRFRLTPAFGRSIVVADHRRTRAALRASLAVEAACAILILGLVALLGTLEPPAS